MSGQVSIMEDEFIISELAKRRATLSDQIERLRAQLRQMLSDLEALDAASRIFDGSRLIEKPKSKAWRSARNLPPRGEFVRLIFNILREAPGPLSGRDITRAVMVFKKLDISNPQAVTSMRKLVGYALRRKRKSGHLRSYDERGPFVLWEIVSHSNAKDHRQADR